MAFSPDETDSPLIVDADRMLPVPFASQYFEPVARRHTQIIDTPGVIEQTQFLQSHALNIRRKSAAAPAFPDCRSFGIAKAQDHSGV